MTAVNASTGLRCHLDAGGVVAELKRWLHNVFVSTDFWRFRIRCVILEHVSERRSDPDRILVAQIAGTTQRHSRWHALTAEEEAAAVAELREVAGGHADLLAEVAGVGVGFAEEWNEPRPAGRGSMLAGWC